MPVVSNTSPLLNLAIIGQLDLIQQQFSNILIPNAVLAELRIDEALPGSQALQQALQTGWLQVQATQNLPLVTTLTRNLDHGEAEAIALAVEVKAEWLLLDERDGRQVARSLSLPITGVLGILLKAKQTGRLHSLRETMIALQQQAGFHISPKLFADLLHHANE